MPHHPVPTQEQRPLITGTQVPKCTWRLSLLKPDGCCLASTKKGSGRYSWTELAGEDEGNDNAISEFRPAKQIRYMASGGPKCHGICFWWSCQVKASTDSLDELHYLAKTGCKDEKRKETWQPTAHVYGLQKLRNFHIEKWQGPAKGKHTYTYILKDSP